MKTGKKKETFLPKNVIFCSCKRIHSLLHTLLFFALSLGCADLQNCAIFLSNMKSGICWLSQFLVLLPTLKPSRKTRLDLHKFKLYFCQMSSLGVQSNNIYMILLHYFYNILNVNQKKLVNIFMCHTHVSLIKIYSLILIIIAIKHRCVPHPLGMTKLS